MASADVNGSGASTTWSAIRSSPAEQSCLKMLSKDRPTSDSTLSGHRGRTTRLPAIIRRTMCKRRSSRRLAGRAGRQ